MDKASGPLMRCEKVRSKGRLVLSPDGALRCARYYIVKRAAPTFNRDRFVAPDSRPSPSIVRFIINTLKSKGPKINRLANREQTLNRQDESRLTPSITSLAHNSVTT